MKKLIFLLLAALFFLPQLTQAQACMEATSDEGVQIIGFIQPQFEYQFLGEDLTGNSLNESSIYFNRARLGVTGNIPYDFSYYALMEFSPTLNGSRESKAPFLLDAFISYNRFAPYLKVSFGQFKAPFGVELPTACHKLTTIQRSLVVQNLVSPWRDMGVMLTGGTGNLSILGSKTENFFGYSFAVMNGAGINQWDTNNKKDVLGRVTFHPIDLFTLGASYRFGKQPAQSATATQDDERSRLGLDLTLNYKGFMVQGEYVKGSDKGSYTTGGGCSGDIEVHEGSVDRNGFFIQAAYMTPWKFQPVVRLEEFMSPNKNIEAYPWEGNLFEGLFGDTNDEVNSVITYGINYFFNDNVRFQINYLYRAEKGSLIEVDNDAILTQLQIVF